LFVKQLPVNETDVYTSLLVY